jgi:hypothetical protein
MVEVARVQSARTVQGVTEPSAFGRRVRARYGSTADKELDRTVPLTDGELVLAEGSARLRAWGHLPRPVTLRLTTDRILALAHYAFQPDRVWDLPRRAITDAVAADGALTITYRDENSSVATLSVSDWTGALVHGAAIPDVAALRDLVSDWLAH